MADLFSKKQHQAPFSKVPKPWRLGDVPKRFKGPHSKCGSLGNRGVGSNPTISATKENTCEVALAGVFVFFGYLFQATAVYAKNQKKIFFFVDSHNTLPV